MHPSALAQTTEHIPPSQTNPLAQTHTHLDADSVLGMQTNTIKHVIRTCQQKKKKQMNTQQPLYSTVNTHKGHMKPYMPMCAQGKSIQESKKCL